MASFDPQDDWEAEERARRERLRKAIGDTTSDVDPIAQLAEVLRAIAVRTAIEANGDDPSES